MPGMLKVPSLSRLAGSIRRTFSRSRMSKASGTSKHGPSSSTSLDSLYKDGDEPSLSDDGGCSCISVRATPINKHVRVNTLTTVYVKFTIEMSMLPSLQTSYADWEPPNVTIILDSECRNAKISVIELIQNLNPDAVVSILYVGASMKHVCKNKSAKNKRELVRLAQCCTSRGCTAADLQEAAPLEEAARLVEAHRKPGYTDRIFVLSNRLDESVAQFTARGREHEIRVDTFGTSSLAEAAEQPRTHDASYHSITHEEDIPEVCRQALGMGRMLELCGEDAILSVQGLNGAVASEPAGWCIGDLHQDNELETIIELEVEIDGDLLVGSNVDVLNWTLRYFRPDCDVRASLTGTAKLPLVARRSKQPASPRSAAQEPPEPARSSPKHKFPTHVRSASDLPVDHPTYQVRKKQQISQMQR